jgi:hypothetical protein
MIGAATKFFASVPSATSPIWYVGIGSTTGIGGTAAINVEYPLGVRQDDFLLLCVSCGGESTVTTVPSGWTEIDAGRTDIATTAGVKLRVFYKFHDTAYDSYNGVGSAITVSVADHGDHTFGVMLAWRNVNTTTPLDVTSLWTSSSSAVTTMSFPELTTVTADCLYIGVGATPEDTTNSTHETITAAGLTSTAERFDDGTTNGHGSALYVMQGNKTSAGATGTPSVAKTTSTTYVCRAIALRPA